MMFSRTWARPHHPCIGSYQYAPLNCGVDLSPFTRYSPANSGFVSRYGIQTILLIVSLTRKTPFRSNSSMKRNGRLRFASTKRKEQYGEYNKLKKEYIANHPLCERCRKVPTSDLHHKAGRMGKWLCDTRYFAGLCRKCHDWVGANGKEAEREGWIVRIW